MDRKPHRDGYSTALTAPGPVPFRWWELFLRFSWWFSRLGPVKRWLSLLDELRGWFGLSSMKKLTFMSFINAARWSVVHRVPPSNKWWHREGGLPSGYLHFEVNFNGETDPYLEAFSLVMAGGMRNFWGDKLGFDGAYGVPDMVKVTEFLHYVNERKNVPAYHYCAYPEASTKMIRGALELKHRIDDFQRRTAGKAPEEKDAAWQQVYREAQFIRNPRARIKPGMDRPEMGYLTAVAAVRPGRNDALRGDLKSLYLEPHAVPGGVTHFARWVLVDKFDAPPGNPPPGSRPLKASYLIFSAWFDGTFDAFAARLQQSLGGRAIRIWRHCGYEGGGPMALRDFLRPQLVNGGIPHIAYDGVTVEEIRLALAWWETFTSVQVAAQRLEGAALRAMFVESGILDP